MKIIEKDNKTIAVLNDGDLLEVEAMQGNPLHITIKCINGTFLVDEVTVKRIKEIKIEQEQVEILKKQNHKNES